MTRLANIFNIKHNKSSIMKEFLSNTHSAIVNEFLDPLAALRQTLNININHVHQLRSDLLSVVAYLRSGVPGITEPWELQ